MSLQDEHRKRVLKALAKSPQKLGGRPLRVKGSTLRRDDPESLLSSPEEPKEPISPSAGLEGCEDSDG